ncbi:MAG: hypothetical protein NC428_07520 [Clostridium sp.]|nr:hypothetical protein [Clostridium sp.]
MKYQLKQAINEQLCRMAGSIQMNSSSHFLWGEVELPECLKRELEEETEKFDE